MCADIVSWLAVVSDHGQHLVGQRMNWLVCNSHEDVAKEMFHYDSRGLDSDMLVKPSLAETQFRVEVRRLKCVKYKLDKISSSVDVLCPLFFLRKISPSSGCLPHGFRAPGLLFHLEHTFLSSPPASPLPRPSRNQGRAERRNKTAI